MIVAAVYYQDSIAPLFESAKSLLTLRIKDNIEKTRVKTNISSLIVTEKAILIRALEPDIFICNSISGFWYNYFMSNNVFVYPSVLDSMENVIENVCKKKFDAFNYRGQFPFCRRQFRKREDI